MHPLTKLEELDLMVCRSFTDVGLFTLLRKCPNLKSINLYHANISGEQPSSRDLLLRLKTLKLVGCVQLTDAGLSSMLRQTPNLVSLDISGCAGITGEQLDLMDPLMNLETVNLIECTAVTVAGLI